MAEAPPAEAGLPADLAALLEARPPTLVLTGAGVSAESGIPTFREAQTGLWARFSPSDLATPEAFAAHPRRVWDWYRWRRECVLQGGPNAAHRAIADLQAALPECRVVTQNVDGLHQAAGAADVAELHGNLWRQRCSAGCGHVDYATEAGAGDPPACPGCGALLRPDVVWFGETLPMAALETAERALATADLVLVVGTSNLVYPAAALPEQALAEGRTVVEVNPEATSLSGRVRHRLAGPASIWLPAIAAAAAGTA